MPPRLHLNSDWSPPGEPPQPLPVGVILPPRVRQPQFPLKDRRTLFSDAEIVRARENVARYPSARKLADEIVQAAAYWVEWEDAALRDLIATAEVPRAFDCSPAGCPKCGKKIFEVAKSTYPWRIDPHRPFKVACPVCASVFPSNDYGQFYRSGFKDRSDFYGPYVDDGRGWLSPDGERYWFVAHANHWTWYWHPQADNPTLLRGCEALGRAYLLTGDRLYAHKAAVILHRIAEVYPNMDHAPQSRMGEFMARTVGEIYPGKVVNAIWESYISAQFAETYDAIWETIDDDRALQTLTGRTGPELRAGIEANLLEEVIDAYYQVKTRGNYGMHQRSLLQTALVRQHTDHAQHLAAVVDKPDGAIFLGLRYALHGQVWRDGHPYEVGDYNFAWVSNLILVAGLLVKLGVDLTGLPRLRRLLNAPLDSLCIGRLTPAIGDSQTVYANPVGVDAGLYQQALRTYGDPRYAKFLAGLGATGENSFASFVSLLQPPVAVPAGAPASGRLHEPQPSRLLSGFGLSLMNNPADTVGFSLYHGLHLNHRHFDRLHFDVFAQGQAMMPDLGYPDAMNAMVAGVFTWSLTTISHNTVTVDAALQPGNVAGLVELQAEGGRVRAVAVNAAGTYPQCPVYRRTLVMVDADDERSYLLDFFDVEGGCQHDYSLHGPPGDFQLSGGEWAPPAAGTLAGEAVRVGTLYDDPALASPDNKDGYSTYRGSGFQHLEKVRLHRNGEWSANYTHERDAAAQLRLRVLPQAGQQLMLAEARVSPVKWPQVLRYVIARREGQAGLTSKFVSLIEPHAGIPFLQTVHRHDIPGGAAVSVTHMDGRTEVIMQGLPGVPKRIEVAGRVLLTDARVTVFSFAADGALVWLWLAEGTHAGVDDDVHHSAPPLVGRVVAVDPTAQTVRIALESANDFGSADSLAGRVVHFGLRRTSANTAMAARLEGGELVLVMRDDLTVGLVHVRTVAPARIETSSHLMLAATYVGAGLRNAAGRCVGQVQAAGEDWIEPVASLAAHDLAPGEDLTITQTWPGDRFEVPAVHAWRR